MNSPVLLDMLDGYSTVALTAVMLPIVISLAAFLMIFGIEFLKNRERMSMIERGMNPHPEAKKRNPFFVLRAGLLSLGVGLGLVTAYVIDTAARLKDDTDPLYFSLIFLMGGLGLLVSFIVERRITAETEKFPEKD